MAQIKLLAALPPIQSAISIDGQGDGARVKLDISRQYMAEVIELQKLAGRILVVTIEEKKQ